MPTKQQMLKTIAAAYRLRNKGDVTGLANYWAPDAVFTLVASPLAMGKIPTGPADAVAAVEMLIKKFALKDQKRGHTFVEGNTVAINWHLTVVNQKGDSAETELFDIWEFNRAGKVKSLKQFADTALLKKMW
jgi:ketosteroid isomerase-like protein